MQPINEPLKIYMFIQILNRLDQCYFWIDDARSLQVIHESLMGFIMGLIQA